MEFINRIKNINYRHYICIGICIGFLLISVFCFTESYFRIWESLKSLWYSLEFWFCRIFGLDCSTVPTVNNLSEVIETPLVVPSSWDVFKLRIENFASSFISDVNFIAYFNEISSGLFYFVFFLMLLLPVLILIIVFVKHYFKIMNNKYDHDSLPLRYWKKFSFAVIHPVKVWLSGFLSFAGENLVYKKICIFIICFSFNFGAIIINLIAYYFYFTASFDITSLFNQFVKLAVDLSLIFRVPLIVWIPIVIYLIALWRKRVGYKRLNRFEFRNWSFIKRLPICILIKGVMNAGKTKFLTDMGISLENMFRQEAKELLYRNDLKFPDFPWINFERGIDLAVKYGEIYNLVSCREYVRKKAERFAKDPCRSKIYGYDFERYGMEYDDNLKINNLFDVLETYAQLYYIYTMTSPVVAANYSTRYDNILLDNGNFPEWDTVIFEKTSLESEENTSYSHILDYDMLRLGRKVEKNNDYSNAFEFGVILLTEGGKERGNQFDTNEEKRKADETNRKNDMFNQYLKLIRSASTVDFTPFVRLFMDEQRYQSLNADNRELCNIIDITDVTERRLTMPCFWFEELAHDLVFDRFFNAYYKYRFNRADNTLFMYFLKFTVSKIINHYERIYNTFGYEKYKIENQRGELSGDIKKQEYFLMSKKIYSNRYCTDVFGGYFEKKAKKSLYGLNDVPTYSGLRATDSEIKLQHSFFFNELEKYSSDDEIYNSDFKKQKEAEIEVERIKRETEKVLKKKPFGAAADNGSTLKKER